MQTKHAYQNTELSIEQRVDDLMQVMTIEEKVAQLAGIWTRELIDTARHFLPDKAKQVIPHGIGHVTRIGAVSLLPPQQSAELANTIQRYLREGTRLGIPAIVHEESCAGYTARDATSFPQAIGQAATWNPELVQQAAAFIREEMRAVGAHHTLAPVLDVARDPRWGRLEETYGEDPYLISVMGGAYIRGVQGEDWHQGIVATAKHFIGYGFSEGGLNWAPAHIPERLMREIYLTPFAAAIREAGVGSVMNAYQELDGVPAGSDRNLMVSLLRDELGFDGVVVADYFTINMFVQYHKIAATKSEAARYGLEASIDVELPQMDCYGTPLMEALARGEIDPALIDVSVRRLLSMKFRLGLFENPFVDTGAVPTIYSNPAPVTLSRTMAEQSIVLLKNDGLLPISTSVKTIAVMGEPANSARLLQADYHYPSHMEGIASPNEANMEAPAPGEAELVVDWDEHRPPTVTILDGIRQVVGDTANVVYVRGCGVTDPDTSGIAEAVEAARNAEVAVIVAGDLSGLGLGSTSGEAIDSATLALPGVQPQLIEAVLATGTPTILVLTNGRPPVLTDLVEKTNAILEAWLPAEQGGAAVANVLFGVATPGGKLPVSFPRHVGQVPVYYNHKPSGQRSHWYGDYADMSVKPLFAFGHGLSYTTFTYSDLTLSHQSATAADTVAVSVSVQNTGSYAGDEVVQLYVADPIASVTRPVKALKGFQRVHLEPGQQSRLTFHVPIAHFAFYDRQMRYVVEPGEVRVMVGSASDDIRLDGTLTITGETTEVQQVFSTRVEVNA
ncbi:MAG: glycoside hydrolase family 3 N-terminal domain-containing protein [Anaerolineae bacterium]